MSIITITPLKALQLMLTRFMTTGSMSSWTSQVHNHSEIGWSQSLSLLVNEFFFFHFELTSCSLSFPFPM